MSADFFASYLSGAIGILIGNPLDVLKTRLQASPSPSPAAAPSPTSTAHFSTLSSYLRGAPAPLLGYGALNAILFVTYNRTLGLLGEPDFQAPRRLGAVWLAGAAGGLASFVVSAPTELVKCRVQVLDRAAGAAGEPAASSWGVAREVVRREGLRGLYFGGAVTSVRDAVGYGFYFWSYELLKQAWTRREESVAGGTVGEADADAALKVLVCGGVAGVVTWASIFPLDVVKTRVQTQAFETPAIAGERQTLLGGASTGAPRRVGAWQVARQAYLNEGFAVFFRGLGVCSVRAFIVNAVQWAVYEWTMQILLKQNQTHQI